MITRRIIPCLLLSGKKLVKTVQFKSPKYIGDPINAVKIFNDKEVDELMILDIEASLTGAAPQFEYLKEVVSEAFIPLSYGGGIRNLQHIDQLLQMGIEKVCLNSINATSFELIAAGAKKYGSQSILGIIDLKKNIFGKYGVYFKNKTFTTKLSIKDYALALQDVGAGEILINFVDTDGTYKGFDLNTLEEIVQLVRIPVVVVGGAGNLGHLKNAFDRGASAVSAGSLFVYHGPHKAVLINYPTREQIEKIIF